VSQYAKAIGDFQRSVEITRDVRFQAAIRLTARHTASAYVVSILSLFVIGLSVIPNVYALEAYQSQILLGSSIVLSAFVIFTSLIDGAKNFYHQGELLHACARKVATVYHELKNVDPIEENAKNWEILRGLQEEYRAALDDCPVNHANVDFLKVQSRKPPLFQNDYSWGWEWGEARFKRVLCFVGCWAWILPHVIALAVVSFIVYQFILSVAPYAE
jgi:hypothetical protein